MPSAVPFTDLNQSKDHICQAQTTDNRFADTTLNKIPTVNLNAAISSSLKLKHGPAYLHQVSTLDLLDKTISFHCSPAAPLDKLMKSRIERMPNSLVLINKTADNVQGMYYSVFIHDCSLHVSASCAISFVPSPDFVFIVFTLQPN